MKLSKFFELQKLDCIVLSGTVYCPSHGILLNKGDFDELVNLLRLQTKELEEAKKEIWDLKQKLKIGGN